MNSRNSHNPTPDSQERDTHIAGHRDMSGPHTSPLPQECAGGDSSSCRAPSLETPSGSVPLTGGAGFSSAPLVKVGSGTYRRYTNAAGMSVLVSDMLAYAVAIVALVVGAALFM